MEIILHNLFCPFITPLRNPVSKLLNGFIAPYTDIDNAPLILHLGHRYVCSSKALPLSVSRYFYLLLRGLSGIVISIKPVFKAGVRYARRV